MPIWRLLSVVHADMAAFACLKISGTISEYLNKAPQSVPEPVSGLQSAHPASIP